MERLYAGWRIGQPSNVGSDGQLHANLEPEPGKTLFETIEQSNLPDEKTYVLKRREHTFAVLNVYPYNPGHVMVLPNKGVRSISDLDDRTFSQLWEMVRETTAVVKQVYAPLGLNIGVNEGLSGGGSQHNHLHVHIVPRWSGDTNFMTAVSDIRVLPETLKRTWERLQSEWPD